MKNRKISWVERYIKEVHDALVCSSKEKKRFMVDFRENVYSCYAEEPGITDEKLRERFGTPKEISDSFVSDEDPSFTRRNLISKRIQKFALLFLIVLAIIAVILLFVHVHDNYLYNHGETVLSGPFEGTPPPKESMWDVY